ncbi:MAG TPA: AAA family ATPase [Myxococcaceae bacterium]|nr:AAA family ATPase [Myxococcaceae bacterium]
MATELPKEERTPEQRLFLDVLEFFRAHMELPNVQAFRIKHEDELDVLKRLVDEGSLRVDRGGYRPTVTGLLTYADAEAEKEFESFARLLPAMRAAYQREPGRQWTAGELSALAQMPVDEVVWVLKLFIEDMSGLWVGYTWGPNGSNVTITLAPEVLKAQPFDVAALREEKEQFSGGLQLKRLRVDGYRALEGFEAQLDPLTVIIGANASGKSSLFDLLAFVSFATVNPLPAEIDPRSVGRTLFHLGAPERIDLSLLIERDTARPLRYAANIRGPIGSPSVAWEQLVSMKAEPGGGTSEAFKYLDFRGGKGTVRGPRQMTQPPWTLPGNELALRRALDPNLITLNRFREYVSSWGFYAGFDVGRASAIRRPVPTEPEPILREDGANLSAVLAFLMTEHSERWEELETHLRSAIPAFQSLSVKFKGGPGTAIGVWRESGVSGVLTLADLSDGTLKFLCWATLCLSPQKPPLVCVDEPELGLHPRVLPVLAGLLRQASADSQFLVATHSPYLLSQFSLEEIAVMKKVEGRAVLTRPASNEALRREIEELGTGELARLHLSDELEARS